MQFMIGRNGNDEINRFLLAVDMVLILLSVIFSRGSAVFFHRLHLFCLDSPIIGCFPEI